MSKLTPKRRELRARIAASKRHHPEADHTDAERELKVARAADYITNLIESAPPLRPQDVERLRALLPAVPVTIQDGGEPDAA